VDGSTNPVTQAPSGGGPAKALDHGRPRGVGSARADQR
jgi:hypothetical protein